MTPEQEADIDRRIRWSFRFIVVAFALLLVGVVAALVPVARGLLPVRFFPNQQWTCGCLAGPSSHGRAYVLCATHAKVIEQAWRKP